MTVLLAVSNGERYLGTALASALRQTVEELELLVVDDGSTDATPEILGAIADPRLRVLRNEERLGLAASLNRGLDEARGRYVARLDADDVALPRRLERQLARMRSGAALGIVGSAVIDIDAVDRPGDAGRHAVGRRGRPLGLPLQLALLPPERPRRSRAARPARSPLRPGVSGERGLRPLDEAPGARRRRQPRRAAPALPRSRAAGVAAATRRPARVPARASRCGRSRRWRPSWIPSAPSSPGASGRASRSRDSSSPRWTRFSSSCAPSRITRPVSTGAPRRAAARSLSRLARQAGGSERRRLLRLAARLDPAAPAHAVARRAARRRATRAAQRKAAAWIERLGRPDGHADSRDGRLPGADAVSRTAPRSRRRAARDRPHRRVRGEDGRRSHVAGRAESPRALSPRCSGSRRRDGAPSRLPRHSRHRARARRGAARGGGRLRLEHVHVPGHDRVVPRFTTFPTCSSSRATTRARGRAGGARSRARSCRAWSAARRARS